MRLVKSLNGEISIFELRQHCLRKSHMLRKYKFGLINQWAFYNCILEDSPYARLIYVKVFTDKASPVQEYGNSL